MTHQLSDTSRLASVAWHADITFEPVPSDYAMLKIHTLPETGGDTVGRPEFVIAMGESTERCDLAVGLGI